MPKLWQLECVMRDREEIAFVFGCLVGAVGSVAVAVIIIASLCL